MYPAALWIKLNNNERKWVRVEEADFDLPVISFSSLSKLSSWNDSSWYNVLADLCSFLMLVERPVGTALPCGL